MSLGEKERLQEELDGMLKGRDELTGDVLDELLPEAFAVVKEACRRLVGKKFDLLGNPAIWDMVPFDVQLIGGMVRDICFENAKNYFGLEPGSL